MQEMSTAGAKVINAQAVQFAKEAGIIIYARSTFNPGKETLIKTISSGETKGVTGIVHENDVVRIILSYNKEDKEFYELLKLLEAKQVGIKELNVTETEKENIKSKASFVVSFKNIYGWESFKSNLEKRFKDKIEFDYDLSALSIIGEGLNRDNEILLESLKLFDIENIGIAGISTTSYRLSFLLPKNKLENGIILLHKKWIEDKI
jgi:aspartate kinase